MRRQEHIGGPPKAIEMRLEDGPILKIASVMDTLNHYLSMLDRPSDRNSLETEHLLAQKGIAAEVPVSVTEAAYITKKVSLILSARFPYIEAEKIKELVSKSVANRVNQSQFPSMATREPFGGASVDMLSAQVSKKLISILKLICRISQIK